MRQALISSCLDGPDDASGLYGAEMLRPECMHLCIIELYDQSISRHNWQFSLVN